MKTTKRRRRIFTPEFKRQAVALFETSGRKVAAVAAEIDVSETVLRHWIAQFGAGAAPAASRAGPGLSLADQAAEIARLRRENGIRTPRAAGQAAFARMTCASGFQFHGRSAARSDIGWSPMRASTSASHVSGSTPFSFAV